MLNCNDLQHVFVGGMLPQESSILIWIRSHQLDCSGNLAAPDDRPPSTSPARGSRDKRAASSGESLESDEEFDPETLFDDNIEAGKAKKSKSKKDRKKTLAKPPKKKKKEKTEKKVKKKKD